MTVSEGKYGVFPQSLFYVKKGLSLKGNEEGPPLLVRKINDCQWREMRGNYLGGWPGTSSPPSSGNLI